MNVQERALLTGFLQQLAQAQAGAIDGEALALMGETLARQPLDTGYQNHPQTVRR